MVPASDAKVLQARPMMFKFSNLNALQRIAMSMVAWISIICWAPPVIATPEEAQLEYAAGVMDYQKGLYRSAAKHFQASVDKDPQAKSHCLRRLYLAHSYAGLRELDKAIPLYQDLINNCFGSPEAKLAKECMERLQPSAKVNLGKGILNRITILAPIESKGVAKHSPVSPQYISLIKSTLQRFPPVIYKSLDESNCTITIGPNIIDKWPDAGEKLAPGKTTKLSEDVGRTYGMDVYFWERPLINGPGNKKMLGPAFEANEVKEWVYTLMGHVVCEIEGVNEDPLLIDAYKKDCEGIPEFMKDDPSVVFYTSQTKMGPGEVAAGALEELLMRRKGMVLEVFPRSSEWVRKKFKL